MMTMTRRFPLFAAFLSSLVAAGCAMEVEGEDEAELTEVEGAGSQVCVYEHANFAGKSACWGGVQEGRKVVIHDLFDAPVGNDQISSFKVKKGVKVRFFRDTDTEGPDYRANGFFGQVADANLGAGSRPVGNDSISSMVIERNADVADSYDDPQLCLYSNDNYLGDSVCYGGLRPGQRAYVPALFHTAVGNDRASSISVGDGIRVELHTGVNYGGNEVALTSSHRSLGSAGLGNDALSSFVIQRK